MRPNETRAAPKRFYERAEATPEGEAFAVALDGRLAKSPGRRPLAGPEPLVTAMAEEWAAQGERLDMTAMPLTALHGRFLDADEETRAAWNGTVLAYAGTDLLCYRGDDPTLAKRQADTWQPFLDRVGEAVGGRFAVTEGIVAVQQPAEVSEGLERLFENRSEAARYAAAILTEITGSATLAVAILLGDDPDRVFAASRLDERYQEERWGQDAEAKAREEALERDFAAVVRYLHLADQRR